MKQLIVSKISFGDCIIKIRGLHGLFNIKVTFHYRFISFEKIESISGLILPSTELFAHSVYIPECVPWNTQMKVRVLPSIHVDYTYPG